MRGGIKNTNAPTMRGAVVLGFGERRGLKDTTADRLVMPAAPGTGQRLPAYGRELCAELLKGRTPNVRLFCGHNAWTRADEWRLACGAGSALVLPNDVDPESVKWPAVNGLLVVFRESDPRALARKQAIARALIRDGVRFVLLEHEGQPIIARAAQGGA